MSEQASMSEQTILKRIDRTHAPMIAARLLIAAFFIYFGIVKIADPVEFLKQIREYQLLPESPPIFINLTAVAMPWIEVLCGVAVLLGIWIRGAGLVALAMLMAFTPAVLMRAIDVYNAGGVAFCDIAFDCGCGGGVINTCRKLLENGTLMAAAVILLLSQSRFLALQPLRANRPTG